MYCSQLSLMTCVQQVSKSLSYKQHSKVTRWASLYLLATEKEETHGNLPKVKMAELGYFLRFEDYIYLAKSVYRNNSQILRGITPRRRG